MEKWNAYTENGALINQILLRDEPIPDGLYHLVCEVLVRHVDGSYLCMKRDPSKPIYPGYYEATAGGSALMGET
nr:NUDIX hydrolase [Clostridia bacterium]